MAVPAMAYPFTGFFGARRDLRLVLIEQHGIPEQGKGGRNDGPWALSSPSPALVPSWGELRDFGTVGGFTVSMLREKGEAGVNDGCGLI